MQYCRVVPWWFRVLTAQMDPERGGALAMQYGLTDDVQVRGSLARTWAAAMGSGGASTGVVPGTKFGVGFSVGV